jgi:hypothetical protein
MSKSIPARTTAGDAPALSGERAGAAGRRLKAGRPPQTHESTLDPVAARETRSSIQRSTTEVLVATHPTVIPQRFQSALGWLKARRNGINVLATLTAVLLAAILAIPFVNQLSTRLPKVLADSGIVDRPFGVWSFS